AYSATCDTLFPIQSIIDWVTRLADSAAIDSSWWYSSSDIMLDSLFGPNCNGQHVGTANSTSIITELEMFDLITLPDKSIVGVGQDPEFRLLLFRQAADGQILYTRRFNTDITFTLPHVKLAPREGLGVWVYFAASFSETPLTTGVVGAMQVDANGINTRYFTHGIPVPLVKLLGFAQHDNGDISIAFADSTLPATHQTRLIRMDSLGNPSGNAQLFEGLGNSRMHNFEIPPHFKHYVQTSADGATYLVGMEDTCQCLTLTKHNDDGTLAWTRSLPGYAKTHLNTVFGLMPMHTNGVTVLIHDIDTTALSPEFDLINFTKDGNILKQKRYNVNAVGFVDVRFTAVDTLPDNRIQFSVLARETAASPWRSALIPCRKFGNFFSAIMFESPSEDFLVRALGAQDPSITSSRSDLVAVDNGYKVMRGSFRPGSTPWNFTSCSQVGNGVQNPSSQNLAISSNNYTLPQSNFTTTRSNRFGGLQAWSTPILPACGGQRINLNLFDLCGQNCDVILTMEAPDSVEFEDVIAILGQTGQDGDTYYLDGVYSYNGQLDTIQISMTSDCFGTICETNYPKDLTLCPLPLNPSFTLDEDPCVAFQLELADYYAVKAYEDYQDSIASVFDSLYVAHCMDTTKMKETFDFQVLSNNYHYTLYYFDQSGNLLKTIPPAGVEPLDPNLQQAVDDARNAGSGTIVPDHELTTQYRYNSLNQRIWESTPDGGISQMWYDDLGRVVVSQDARQAPLNRYSYTKYDPIGRMIESGELRQLTAMTHILS
ncbi:MAG: hypothetical protein AAFR59_07770, partial [Bacteroidota bacterium]